MSKAQKGLLFLRVSMEIDRCKAIIHMAGSFSISSLNASKLLQRECASRSRCGPPSSSNKWAIRVELPIGSCGAGSNKKGNQTWGNKPWTSRHRDLCSLIRAGNCILGKWDLRGEKSDRLWPLFRRSYTIKLSCWSNSSNFDKSSSGWHDSKIKFRNRRRFPACDLDITSKKDLDE